MLYTTVHYTLIISDSSADFNVIYSECKIKNERERERPYIIYGEKDNITGNKETFMYVNVS